MVSVSKRASSFLLPSKKQQQAPSQLPFKRSRAVSTSASRIISRLNRLRDKFSELSCFGQVGRHSETASKASDKQVKIHQAEVLDRGTLPETAYRPRTAPRDLRHAMNIEFLRRRGFVCRSPERMSCENEFFSSVFSSWQCCAGLQRLKFQLKLSSMLEGYTLLFIIIVVAEVFHERWDENCRKEN